MRGNIAYNLHLLGGAPIPMGTVGQDFGPYREHFETLGIDLSRVKIIDDLFTPQAFITTDHDNNQITAFHPGAMMRSYENHVRDVPGVTLGLVGPDGREGMIQNAEEFAAGGIPFIFDPGQAMPLFNGPELREFIEQADYVVVNDYESNLLQERTAGTSRTSCRACRPTSPRRARRARWCTRPKRPTTSRRRTSAAWWTPPAAATPSAPG